MKKLLTIVCISGFMSACGGGASDGEDTLPIAEPAGANPVVDVPLENPYEISTLEFSKEQVEEMPNQTAQIMVSPEFDFKTSRSVDLSIDFGQANEKKGTVLVCTDYSAVSGSYQVDYDSCLVRASVENGQFTDKLKILSRYSKVLAIMWFAEPGSAPAYQEIDLSAS